MSKRKIIEALLVISTAFLVLYLFGLIKHGESKEIFIYMACGIGICGIFIKPLARLIAWAWYKLADLLSLLMSKIIMTLVFIVVLVPIATLYKLMNKDKMGLRRSGNSKWLERNHLYTPEDLKNIW